MSPPLNPLAIELNERLEAAAPEVLGMLSSLGRRLYFPKGILSQSAEAKAKAHRFNATIGIATEDGAPMHLRSIARHLVDVEPEEAFSYAPPAGQQALRERWRQKALAENPSLGGKTIGLPIVTSAITHGLSLVGDLFVDPGDRIVLPDKLWGNYRLTYEVRLGAELVFFPFYAGDGFDVEAFARTLAEAAQGREKLIVLLNFLYHLGGASLTESLFGPLSNRHENLLAVRLDGATKELFVWGLRCGFLTFGPGRAEAADEVAAVLDAKVRGAIRSGISNVCQLSQSLVEKALASPEIDAERQQKCEVLRARAERVYEVARAPRFRESWEVYPFNSGYFMCVRANGVEAESVRLKLLDRYGVGVIAAGGSDLRIAFSCLQVEDVEPLFDSLHRAIQELV
jgi:aspartate/methionine/tyrosine aminotransferase